MTDRLDNEAITLQIVSTLDDHVGLAAARLNPGIVHWSSRPAL